MKSDVRSRNEGLSTEVVIVLDRRGTIIDEQFNQTGTHRGPRIVAECHECIQAGLRKDRFARPNVDQSNLFQNGKVHDAVADGDTAPRFAFVPTERTVGQVPNRKVGIRRVGRIDPAFHVAPQLQFDLSEKICC